MISKTLINAIEKILEVSRKNRISLMFMGGIAASAWGNPRATYDIDGVILIDLEELSKFLNQLSHKGFSYNKKEPVKIISDMAFVTLTYGMGKQKPFVDLFLAQSEYTKGALRRRRQLTLNKTRIPVISPEDLIIYKLLSGRTKDLEDIRSILLMQKGKLDKAYMKKWAKQLGISTFLKDELNSVSTCHCSAYL